MRILRFWIAPLISVLVAGLVLADGGMRLTSPAFDDGGRIPVKYAYCGQGAKNVSPALEWAGVPEGTKSFLLLVHDPDAPAGDFVHWIAYDIPAAFSGLPEGASGSGEFLEGKNDFGFLGYGGPCPPRGQLHHYYFEVYALSVSSLSLPAGASLREVVERAGSYVLGEARLIGVYQR